MKALSILLTLLVAIGLVYASPTLAAEKSIDYYFLDDVDYEHWAYEELERFVYADIIDGYVSTEKFEEDGEEYEYSYVSIKPQNSITRAEFTKILVNAMGLHAGGTAKSFADVKPTSWYYDYINIASSHGIVQGKTASTFNPQDKITRDQMAVMIYRAFGPTIDFSETADVFPDVSRESFAYEAVIKTAAAGIIKGNKGIFNPHKHATRAEAIVMIDRALHLEPGTEQNRLEAVQTVDRIIKEEVNLTAQEDMNALETLYRETAIGYHLAYSLSALEFGMLEEEGISFSMEQVGEHTINAVSVNKQFAEVRIDGLSYQLSMTSPDMSFDMSIDLSGTAYLKKSADGKWKVYNIVFDEEEESQAWLATAADEMN